jgi:hypothetical protein
MEWVTSPRAPRPVQSLSVGSIRRFKVAARERGGKVDALAHHLARVSLASKLTRASDRAQADQRSPERRIEPPRLSPHGGSDWSARCRVKQQRAPRLSKGATPFAAPWPENRLAEGRASGPRTTHSGHGRRKTPVSFVASP